MKLYTVWLVSFMLCTLNNQGQQLSVDIGRISTHFDYKTDQGETLENLYPAHNFTYALGYRLKVTERFYPVAGLVLSGYGAFGSDPQSGSAFSWDTRYLGLAIGAEGEVVKRKAFILFLRLTADPQFMVSGTQTINNEVYNLQGVEQFEHPFLFLRGGGGFNYCVQENIAISVKYLYGYGFPMGDDPTGEQLRMRTSAVSLGLLFSLGRTNYCNRGSFR